LTQEKKLGANLAKIEPSTFLFFFTKRKGKTARGGKERLAGA
jgi:hypothetical protein